MWWIICSIVYATGLFANRESTSYKIYYSSSFKGSWSSIGDANSCVSDILYWILHIGFRYSAIIQHCKRKFQSEK